MRRLLLIPLLALTACAPDQPSNTDARQAMVDLLQSSKKGTVVVTEVHALDLSGCVPATDAEGVVCQVALDVSFTFEGEAQRSDDKGPMRFVREGGKWKVAYAAEATPAP